MDLSEYMVRFCRDGGDCLVVAQCRIQAGLQVDVADVRSGPSQRVFGAI